MLLFLKYVTFCLYIQTNERNLKMAEKNVVLNRDGTIVTMKEHMDDVQGKVPTVEEIDQKMAQEEKIHAAKVRARQQMVRDLKKAEFEKSVKETIAKDEQKGEAAQFRKEDQQTIEECEKSKAAFKKLVEERKQRRA